MKRRRRTYEPTEQATWEPNRDAAVERWTGTGLGLRPERWWIYEAERPDLAGSPAKDMYCHVGPLGENPNPLLLERARARLRYLAGHRQLSAAEVASIYAGSGPRYEWRAAVLSAAGIQPPH